MTDEDCTPQSPVYQTPSPYREAVEDQTERARRLEGSPGGAAWLRYMERTYGIKTR